MSDDKNDSDFRMVAIFRADLPLPPGKMAVQAGHAFVGALQCADQALVKPYMESGQTKIVLVAPDLASLRKIEERAKKRGVSVVLITDAARTVLPEPTETVLGLGPMSKTDSNALTRGLKMM